MGEGKTENEFSFSVGELLEIRFSGEGIFSSFPEGLPPDH